MPAQICVARIGAAHGVRGAVKLWTFTEDPFAVKRYGPLSTKDGARQFEVTEAREAKGHLVATLKGVTTREEAERLNGVELYVAREKLPATEARRILPHRPDRARRGDDGRRAARPRRRHPQFRRRRYHRDRATAGATMLLPFTNAVVPTVDLKSGRVVIELPEEIDGDDPAAA